ncbi:MAG: Sjogren's syndrome/scleroderma autoantigen 1 family protein [Candidatus Hydrothermarchaeota archaeon]
MKDKGIDNMAKLLLAGGKMLGYHCKDCKVPLFDLNGEVICPSCDKKYAFKEEEKPEKIEVKTGVKTEVNTETEIEKSLWSLLDKLSKKLIEGDIKNADDIIEKMDSVASLIEKIKRIRKLG